MTNILITGGAGYIGSHTVVELIERGFTPIIVDNFLNSSSKVLDRIEKITGIRPQLYDCDIFDEAQLRTVFEQHNFDSVIHFAGLKAVGESVEQPLRYYQNNVYGSCLLYTSPSPRDQRGSRMPSSA